MVITETKIMAMRETVRVSFLFLPTDFESD